MSDFNIFLVGVFASLLCLVFLVYTFVEVRRLARESERRIDRKR